MQDWILAFASVTALSVTAFVIVAVMWLKRLRETVSATLTESANQQVRTAQRLSDQIAQLQKQQRHYEQQLQVLAQTSTQLRQGLVSVATRLENNQTETPRSDYTLH
ncbi:MAG: hypothetical protein JO126_05455 [Alphaproteobacteria bacterium]|nr:hypothetical protein [Alphaproteobacteria bacterium]MBV8548883.1 hypothetical protein [Alphaproteobacteria bacterium]